MKRLIVWGGATGLESHRHIHRAFVNTARKIGVSSLWIHDEQNGFSFEDGDVCIAADIWSKHLPYHPGVDYVLHNFHSDHPVIQQADPTRILRLQVWTTDAFGDEWDVCRQFSREHRILFQPWGTDLLAEEFMDPVLDGISRDVVFVGAVWSDLRDGTDLGNVREIEQLKAVCAKNGLTLQLFTQIHERQMVEVTRAARLAPTIVGTWQCDHGYLPCRAFKHASYGVPVFTNSGYVKELFNPGANEFGATVEQVVEGALRKKGKDYLELAREHQKIAARYTYRESLQAIMRALEEGRNADGAPFPRLENTLQGA